MQEFYLKIILYQHVYDFLTLSQEFVHHTNRMKAGDPMAEDTTVGATITTAHADKVRKHTMLHIRSSADLSCGGSSVDLLYSCRNLGPRMTE